MKTILGSRKRCYMRSVSVFLIVVALVAAMVSCTPTPTYNLTMAANPAIGGTATDETNTSPYAEGTVVDIKAVPADCYRFVDWSTTAGTIGNNTATTTFTMPAQDVTVTANFEPIPPNHYKFYWTQEGAPYIGEVVQLEDQFGTFNATVGYAMSFGNPVEKVHGDVVTPISDPDRHFTLYELEYDQPPNSWQVMVNNQFQDDEWLTVQGPFWLAVPTQKGDHEAPECLDHLLVYDVLLPGPLEPQPIAEVDLHDQFLDELGVVVYEPLLFANPVQKEHPGGTVTEIQNPHDHWVFYPIDGDPVEQTVQIDNQFGEQTLDLTYPDVLAVPSQKISWEQPLDHFKCYWAAGAPVDEDVQLEDQFVTINATVGAPYLFGNPVEKWHGDMFTPISNWNNHYTFYYIMLSPGVEPQMWEVEVTNQFGIDQLLLVEGPLYLAVPTQKGPHDPPVGLDHLLVYNVVEYEYQYPDITVYLYDQFTEQEADMWYPHYFANPVQKTHGSVVTDIKNDDHMVFYMITGGEFDAEVPVANQFGQQGLYVYEGEGNILGLPSVKTYWEPWEPMP